MSLPNINFLYLTVSDIYSPDKILKVKVTTVRSKVKSTSHHQVAHLQTLTNGFRDIVLTRYLRSRSLQQGHRSNQGTTSHCTLNPLTNVPTKYQLLTHYGLTDTTRINFFSLPAQPPIWTPWVKTIPT